MKTNMDLLYTGSNFSSKEISFIKSDSDAMSNSDFAPKNYLSDLLLQENRTDDQLVIQFNEFIRKIVLKLDETCLPENGDKISDTRFTCAVIRLISNESVSSEFCHDKDQIQNVIDAINTAVTEKNGIWQHLFESVFIIAIWGDAEPAKDVLSELVRRVNADFRIECHAGAAIFPFMDFLPNEVVCNSVKALDHAAFFAPGTLTFFDDVTQNIYGDLLYQLGKIDLAAKEYEKGLEIKKDNLNLLNSLGVCYSLVNRLELARDQFKKAIILGESSQLKKEKILKYSDEDQDSNQQSLSEPDPAFELPTGPSQPGDTDDSAFMLMYNAALICNLMDDLENGIVYIKRATALNSHFFEAELTAGILFLKAGITGESELHLKNAIALNPQSGMAHRILGELYLQNDLPQKAANEYTKSIKLNPMDACSISGLARAFEIQNKNLDIALDLALQSLAIAPDNPYFRIRLAKIYMKKGQYDFAEVEFSTADKYLKDTEPQKDGDDKLPLFADSADNSAIPKTTVDNPEIDSVFQCDDEKETTLKKKSA